MFIVILISLKLIHAMSFDMLIGLLIDLRHLICFDALLNLTNESITSLPFPA